jgi:hypothetical protein
MIYKIDDTYIDLSKLEYVEAIIKSVNCFRYQINGHVYNTENYDNFTDIRLLRENLIEAWKEYKEQR